MPRYNIYVRPDDDAIWQALANKSAFIHAALHATTDATAAHVAAPAAVATKRTEAPAPSAPASREKQCPKHGVAVSICQLMKH